jgi:hypothetical protein
VRETAELLLGKRALPLSGGVLEILYEGGRAQALVFTDRDGKKSRYKVEAPAPELLVPQLGKDRILQQRVLDLRGETLTGGRRSYCLLSYSTLVECATEPAERVVKIGFP